MFKYFEVYTDSEWESGRAGKGESKERSGDNEIGVGDNKKEIWKGLSKKDVVV